MSVPLPDLPAASGSHGGIPGSPARPVSIAGVGGYAPSRVMTNHELETMVETSDEWITTRTGIRERRIAAPDEASSDLALKASRCALEQAGIHPRDIDLIIVPTATPDMIFPGTACILQDRLGATSAGAFDLSSACTGFIYGAATATGLIASGMYDTVLVAAAECMSRIVDWNDRSTCILFGDGAGAAVFRPGDETSRFLGFELGTDGSGGDLLKIPSSGSRIPPSPESVENGQQYIQMAGGEVFKFAVRIVVDASLAVLEKCGFTPSDVDWFIPHQANIRIIDAAVKRLGFSPERVVTNVDRYGNTSAASIPLALDELRRDGRVQKGDLVLMVGFGAGLSWASALLRW
ncbi:MAG: ketoacyl-ACP synthase III [Armatimonadetes bacterium]|nr:ketoacyl-ACP synthase III [Armatimonadota bacterium]